VRSEAGASERVIAVAALFFCRTFFCQSDESAEQEFEGQTSYNRSEAGASEKTVPG
jgi:hypothetical protein